MPKHCLEPIPKSERDQGGRKAPHKERRDRVSAVLVVLGIAALASPSAAADLPVPLMSRLS